MTWNQDDAGIDGGGGGGSGDVTGPASSTEDAIALYNGATGKIIKNSAVTVNGSGSISLPSGQTIDGRDPSVDGGLLDTALVDLDTVISDLSDHVANTSNPHSVTKAQVGLGSVTNDAQLKVSELGTANGVASLDASSRVVQDAQSVWQTGAGGSSLSIAAIADGQVLSRSGTTVAGVGVSGTGSLVATSRTVTAGAGLTGGGDLSADRTFDIVANADGSITVNANDIQVGILASDAQHGSRGGGTQHAEVVAAGAAGFISGSDKSKLDGIESGAQVVTFARVQTALGAATGSVSFNNQALTSVASVDRSGALGLGNTSATSISIGNDSITTTITGNTNLSQGVHTSGSPTGLTFTGGAHTTLAASTEATDVNFNLARTVQFATGALTTQRAVRIQAPTYAFVGASTLTTASTLHINSAPIAGTNATITNPYALYVEAGNTRLGGNLNFDSEAVRIEHVGTGTATTRFIFSANATAAAAVADYTFDTNAARTAGNHTEWRVNNTLIAQLKQFGGLATTQQAATSGTQQMLSLTGAAHTGQTAGTEINFVDVNQGTVTWATGAITTERAYRLRNPTLAFAGSSTVTDAATLAIDGAPTAGTNATITNAYALWLQGGMLRNDGALRHTAVISPAQITGTQDDYAPTGFATTYWMRLDVDAATRLITGLAGGTSGRVVVVSNIATGVLNNISFEHEDAGSSAANRFICPGGVDFVLAQLTSISLIYDGVSSRWRLIA